MRIRNAFHQEHYTNHIHKNIHKEWNIQQKHNFNLKEQGKEVDDY